MAKKAKRKQPAATVVFDEAVRPCGTDHHSLVSTKALLWHKESITLILVELWHKDWDNGTHFRTVHVTYGGAAQAQRIAIAEADKVMAEADQHLEAYREKLLQESLRNVDLPY